MAQYDFDFLNKQFHAGSDEGAFPLSFFEEAGGGSSSAEAAPAAPEGGGGKKAAEKTHLEKQADVLDYLKGVGGHEKVSTAEILEETGKREPANQREGKEEGK